MRGHRKWGQGSVYSFTTCAAAFARYAGCCNRMWVCASETCLCVPRGELAAAGGLRVTSRGCWAPSSLSPCSQAVPGSGWVEGNSCRPGPNGPAIAAANERVCYAILVKLGVR